jgi:hypothetical protein
MGGNAVPLANTAAPPLKSAASSAVHSDDSAGFDSASRMGRAPSPARCRVACQQMRAVISLWVGICARHHCRTQKTRVLLPDCAFEHKIGGSFSTRAAAHDCNSIKRTHVNIELPVNPIHLKSVVECAP